MKALVVQKPGVLEVRDVKEPPMGDYDARCQMLYCGTCAGTDLAVIDGKFAWGNVYPSIIGHEGIGRIVDVGKKVRNFKVGDLISRVYTREYDGIGLSWGAMCEFGLACDHGAMLQDGIDRKIWDMFRINKVIPEGIIDPKDAVMIITWRENLSWVNAMGVKAGDRVLAIGSGANGISIAAMCAVKGAEVTMVGSAARGKNALASGSVAYVDYRNESALKELVKKNTRVFDFIIDATGKKETLTSYMAALKENGVAAVYGMDDYYSYTFNPILGPVSFRWFNAVYDEASAHEEVMDLIRAKKLDAGNWIDRSAIYTWDNAQDAYKDVREKKAIKTALKLSR
jgi:D-arabinose 1-dehydrogenase-like Zn-dependent alcohol dehydrogenase